MCDLIAERWHATKLLCLKFCEVLSNFIVRLSDIRHRRGGIAGEAIFLGYFVLISIFAIVVFWFISDQLNMILASACHISELFINGHRHNVTSSYWMTSERLIQIGFVCVLVIHRR